MTHTTNYNLSQWDAGDRILRDDFNADNARIDAALAASANTIASLDAAKGNCSVEVFTYTGTGTYGEANPTIIHFRAVPKLYFIVGPMILVSPGGAERANIVLTTSTGPAVTTTNTTWDGSTVRIVQSTARHQANMSNQVYTVAAFYA